MAIAHHPLLGQARPRADGIAATLISRFNGRSISKLCATGSITVDEFIQSVADRESFGHGRLEYRQEGEEALSLRQLNSRCGPLSAEHEARICALPLERVEALAEALLDFSSPADQAACLKAN